MSLDYRVPAVIPVLVAVALLVCVLFGMWRRRRERMAPWLIATIVILLAWSLGLTMELTSIHLQDKLLWANLEFVAIMSLPLVWLLTLRRIVDARAPRRWWQVSGWVITALFVAAMFGNPGHLFRGSPSLAVVNGGLALNYDYRILFYAGFVPWAGALLAAGSILLIRGMSQTPLIFRRRNVILLVASLLPMVGLAVYLTDTLPWQSFDPTFLCVSVAVLLCGYAVLRYRVLDMAPLARGAVIEHLTGGVIVLDTCDRVTDFNAAARAICPGLDREAIGRVVGEVLPDQPAITEAVRCAGSVRMRDAASKLRAGVNRQPCSAAVSVGDGESTEWAAVEEPGNDHGVSDNATVVVELGDGDSATLAGQRHFAVSITPMRDRDGGRVGSVIILFDVTRRVQLYREVREMAVTDELTGLLTRRHFRHLANQELGRAARHGLPLSLLVFDIDEFKVVNDSFGHDAGDEVLRAVALVCREQLRSFDVVSRYGGDEFCALLPHVQVPQAMEAAERVRGAVAAHQYHHEGRKFHVTVSMGVAGLDAVSTETLSQLIKASDEALYRAKREGKDRVEASTVRSLLEVRRSR